MQEIKRRHQESHKKIPCSPDTIAWTYPTSLSSIAPGWKGGKLPPLGGSLGEYSLNDFDEQPAHNHRAEEEEGGKKSRDLEEI